MMQSLPPDSAQEQLVEVMEAARTGDQQAFTQLYEHYNGPICTYLAHLVDNDEQGVISRKKPSSAPGRAYQKYTGISPSDPGCIVLPPMLHDPISNASD